MSVESVIALLLSLGLAGYLLAALLFPERF